jgi:AraC-like DNA-binding protein
LLGAEIIKDEPGQEVVLDRLLDPLREPDATVGTVARRVGYGSPFALSTAFKRVRGVSPQEHRADAPGN